MGHCGGRGGASIQTLVREAEIPVDGQCSPGVDMRSWCCRGVCKGRNANLSVPFETACRDKVVHHLLIFLHTV